MSPTLLNIVEVDLVVTGGAAVFARGDGRSVDEICSAGCLRPISTLYPVDIACTYVSVGILIGECACHRSGWVRLPDRECRRLLVNFFSLSGK